MVKLGLQARCQGVGHAADTPAVAVQEDTTPSQRVVAAPVCSRLLYVDG